MQLFPVHSHDITQKESHKNVAGSAHSNFEYKYTVLFIIFTTLVKQKKNFFFSLSNILANKCVLIILHFRDTSSNQFSKVRSVENKNLWVDKSSQAKYD